MAVILYGVHLTGGGPALRMSRFLTTVFVAVVLAFAPGRVGAAAVDAGAEVAAALYAASATQEAVQRIAEAKFNAAEARITALSAKVRAGQIERAELVAAQQDFIAQLAAKDRAYAGAIAILRQSVTDIAVTPQGAAALAEYNAGDEAGALAVLDRLQAADEAARQRATDIQKAVGERRIAELAFDARDKGKVDTASVISRYEQVTRLDPGEFWDWVELSRLYRDAGRTTGRSARRRAGGEDGCERPRQDFGAGRVGRHSRRSRRSRWSGGGLSERSRNYRPTRGRCSD